jgi:hypothetical protein
MYKSSFLESKVSRIGFSTFDGIVEELDDDDVDKEVGRRGVLVQVRVIFSADPPCNTAAIAATAAPATCN